MPHPETPGGRGTMSAQGTPNPSLSMYTSPENPRKRGFVQTPPAMVHKATVLPSRGNESDQKPPASTDDAAVPSPGGTQSMEQAAAGQPSGESSDCWVNDLHTHYQAEGTFKPPSRRQSMSSAGNLDLFNDDLLSVSEPGREESMSPYPFPYTKRDSV